MFARKYRLPARTPLTHSQVVHTSLFSLRIGKNNLGYNRYGFVVSKKIDKRATVRNRLKRRFRACMEQMHEKLLIGNDMLFILKKEAVDVETEQLCEVVYEVFKRTGVKLFK